MVRNFYLGSISYQSCLSGISQLTLIQATNKLGWGSMPQSVLYSKSMKEAVATLLCHRFLHKFLTKKLRRTFSQWQNSHLNTKIDASKISILIRYTGSMDTSCTKTYPSIAWNKNWRLISKEQRSSGPKKSLNSRDSSLKQSQSRTAWFCSGSLEMEQ